MTLLSHLDALVLGRWRARRRAVRIARADAAALIYGFGEAAYDEARTRARDARLGRVIDDRPARHWDRVRHEIGRLTSRDHLDTATRYLEG